MAKRRTSNLNTSDLTCRLADCHGAVKLAIQGILTGDPDQIDAAVGSLSLAESELDRIKNDIDGAEVSRSTKPAAQAVVN